MEIVNFLSELWGFCLIIICMSFLVKPKHVQTLFNIAENEATLLLLGMINIMLGFASILAYNVWNKDLTVIITILGWLLTAKGIFYLFAPETMVNVVAKWKMSSANWIPIILVMGVVLGCILAYIGLTF